MKRLSLVYSALAISTCSDALFFPVSSSIAIKVTSSATSLKPAVPSSSIAATSSRTIPTLTNTIGTFINKTGGRVNNTLSLGKGKVDTILSSAGIPSIGQVQATKFSTFCGTSKTYNRFCKNLQNTVSVCIDRHNNCTDSSTRTLFSNIVDTKPCSLTTKGSLVNTICTRWWTEATRCKNKTKRGPCSIGHVHYLLRELRDFLGLEKGQVSIVSKKARASTEDAERFQKGFVSKSVLRMFRGSQE